MIWHHHACWHLALITCALLLFTACSGASTAPAPERDQTQSPATATVQASPPASPTNAAPTPTAAATSPASATAAASPPASDNPPGFAENPMWQMTLNSIERPGKTLEWSAPPGKVEAKGELIVVFLLIHKTKEGNAATGLGDFELFTDDAVYQPLNCCSNYAISRGLRPLDFSTSFNAEDSSQTLLVFDVPPGLGNATLSFTPGAGLRWQIK